MEIFKYYIIFAVLISCKITEKSIVGTYKSEKSSLINKFKRTLDGEGWLVGSELILNKDSTFTKNTCDLILKGKWSVTNDSLCLKTFKEINKKDSTLQVNYLITKNSKPSYTYLVGNDFFIRKNKSTSGKIFTEKLIRIK